MVRTTVQARRLQRLQQLRKQDTAYASQLVAESKRSRHAAEGAAMASLGQKFEEERAARELQLQEQYDAAIAAVGQGHAGARQANAQQIARASEQYWAFVRSQQAEHQRTQAARDHAADERLGREAPRTDLLKRLHRVKEIEQERAAAAATAAAAAARQQTSAPIEVELDRTHTPSTSTHIHAVRTSTVVRETDRSTATAFEAARAESERAIAARRKDTDVEAARIKAASDRGREALARVKSDQLREQVKQRLVDAQRLVEARERELAMKSAAMQAKQALARAGMPSTTDAVDDLPGAGSDTGSTHSEQSKQRVDNQSDSQPADTGQADGLASSPDRHSDDYREHLRIRARDLQTEQEQLERAAELDSRHLGGQQMAPSTASVAGMTDESAADAVRQTAHTSQRIGELDLALDRLLHRLAPASSYETRAESSAQTGTASDATETRAVAPDPWAQQSTSVSPALVGPTHEAVATSLGTGATRLQATETGSVDSVNLSSHHHQPAGEPRGRIDEVDAVLSQLQQRYDTMPLAAQGSTSRGADAIDGSAYSDALSCSSLSSETSASMHGANSTQSFIAQSDLSEDDAHC